MLSLEKTILDLLLFFKKFFITVKEILFYPYRLMAEWRGEEEMTEELMHPVVFAVVCAFQYFIIYKVFQQNNYLSFVQGYEETYKTTDIIQFLFIDLPTVLSVYAILYLYASIFGVKGYTRRKLFDTCWYWFGISVLVEILREIIGIAIFFAGMRFPHLLEKGQDVKNNLSYLFDGLLFVIPAIAIYRHWRTGNRRIWPMVIVPFFALGGVYYVFGAMQFEKKIIDNSNIKGDLVLLFDGGYTNNVSIKLDTVADENKYVLYHGRYNVYNRSKNTVLLTHGQFMTSKDIPPDTSKADPKFRVLSMVTSSINEDTIRRPFMEVKPDNFSSVDFLIPVFKDSYDTAAVRAPMIFQLSYIESGRVEDLVDSVKFNISRFRLLHPSDTSLAKAMKASFPNP
jgi:hypothetical protein